MKEHNMAAGKVSGTQNGFLDLPKDVKRWARGHYFTLLHIAALGGHSDWMGVLLETAGESANIYTRDKKGASPLCLAAMAGHIDCVRQLLAAGSDPTVRNDDGFCPLHSASQNGHTEVVKTLIDAGGPHCFVDPRTKAGSTPLILAAIGGHAEVVRLIIDAGADADARNKEDVSALHWAARKGHEDIVDDLVDKAGCAADLRTKTGDTALMCAAAEGYVNIVRKLILSGADVNVVNKCCMSALYTAAYKGHVEVVRELLQNKVNIDRKTTLGHTALMTAAYNGNREIVEALVTSGASLEATAFSGLNALHFAVIGGKQDMANLLMQLGRPVNKVPYSLAGISNIMKKSGADITSENGFDGLKPMHAFFAYVVAGQVAKKDGHEGRFKD